MQPFKLQHLRRLALLSDVLSYNNVFGLYSMDRRLREAPRDFQGNDKIWHSTRGLAG